MATITEPFPRAIYTMAIGEEIEIIRKSNRELQTWIRVPGGWIVRIEGNSRDVTVFAPYSTEGQTV